MDEDLKARIYALPTRDELERIFSNFVTKEIFNIELNRIREDIKTLQGHPEKNMGRILWAATILSIIVNIAGILFSHLIWR